MFYDLALKVKKKNCQLKVTLGMCALLFFGCSVEIKEIELLPLLTTGCLIQKPGHTSPNVLYFHKMQCYQTLYLEPQIRQNQ